MLFSRTCFLFGIGFVLYFASHQASAIEGVTMAFCRNTEHGKWRRIVQETFLEIPFRVEPVDCGDIEGSAMAVSIRYQSGKKDTIYRRADQSEEQFIAKAISKISPNRLTPVKGSLEESLDGLDEAVVVFVKEDTNEDFIFQQAVINPFLSKKIKVFKITTTSLLTNEMKKDVTSNLHIWIFTGQERNHVLLPYNSPNKMKLYLIGAFNRLKFPLKFKYESDDVYSKYKGAGFNFFTVYHHTDQEDDVYRTIIDPLVNLFRPFFVFVSVDIDKYQLPSTVSSDSPLPLVVITRDGQRAGVALSSKDTRYATDNFAKLLRSVVDPEIDQELEDDNMFGLSFPDKVHVPSSLPSLTTETYETFVNQHDSCLVAFYLQYTLKSKALLFHLMNVTEMMQSAGMAVAVVNCGKYTDVCEAFSIHQFPTIKHRLSKDTDWITYEGVVSDTALINLANHQSNEHDHVKDGSIVELSPSTLIKLIKRDKLTQLLILVSEVVTDDLHSVLTGVTDNTVYWLNSTLYSKLSDFLVGLSLSPPPVLVWADYVTHGLYRLDMKQPPAVTQDYVKQFIEDISEGKRKPDSEITPTEWKPISPPLTFPSSHFLASLQSQDSNVGDHDKSLIDQQPLYADPNRFTYDEPSKPNTTDDQTEHGQLHQHHEL